MNAFVVKKPFDTMVLRGGVFASVLAGIPNKYTCQAYRRK